MRYFFVFLAALFSKDVLAQCGTPIKLTPEGSIDYSLDYGRSVSMADDYLAIGIPNSDSLGRLAGIVHIYQKVGTDWKKVAALAPSDPQEGFQFGIFVRMSTDYVLVTASGGGGKVYVFKKPAAGWTSQNEIATLKVPGTVSFGSGYGLRMVDISEDQQTIVVADEQYFISLTPLYQGAVFAYHKNPGDEWNSSIPPVIITAPDPDNNFFSRGGIALHENQLAISTPFAPTQNGSIYIFRDFSGDWSNPTMEALLTSGSRITTSFLGFFDMVFTQDGIFTIAELNLGSPAFNLDMIYFQRPASMTWVNATPTCTIGLGTRVIATTLDNVRLATNGNDIYVSSKDMNGTGYFNIYRRGTGDWCNVAPESIEVHPKLPEQSVSRYGIVTAANQGTHAVVGFAEAPGNSQAQLALKVFSQNGSSWDSQLLYPKGSSSAANFYGQSMLAYGDMLFIGSPGDGTVMANSGALYCFQKDGANWKKTNKILRTTVTTSGSFGIAVATDNTYLGVGSGSGVDIYKKNSADWSDAAFFQQLALPPDLANSFGSRITMSSGWLVAAYNQKTNNAAMLAFYRFTGSWTLAQTLRIGTEDVFNKGTVVGLDMEGTTVVAGGSVIQPNAGGQWQIKYTLSPSDPEPIQIAPDFSHLVSNGANFGASVDITGDVIFIGAPARDFNGTWDVGAVYVYTKQPTQDWSSGTQKLKIVPRIIEERTSFGLSVKSFDNTLIVGAPGAVQKVNGTARNKPGVAYVYRPADITWQSAGEIANYTGDRTATDAYGFNVDINDKNIFVAVPYEDLVTGQFSGTVFTYDKPVIIGLVDPLCVQDQPVILSAEPAGGSWSGTGIVNTSTGTFNPQVSGAGTFDITYSVAGCQAQARIIVKPVPAVVFTMPQNQLVCGGKTISIPLSVQPVAGSAYTWYYRRSITDPFVAIAGTTASIQATERGQYQVSVTVTGFCTGLSPVASINDESVSMTTPPVPSQCGDTPGGITLQASPAGGTWSGVGVFNGKFISTGLANAIYKPRYTILSPVGCSYFIDTSIEIFRLKTPQINRTGNICETGTTTLDEVNVEIRPSDIVDFNWYWKALNDPGNFALSNDASPAGAPYKRRLFATQNGYYLVKASRSNCETISATLLVNDQLPDLKLEPSEPEITVCYADAPYKISMSGATFPLSYSWLYSSTSDKWNATVVGNDAVLNAEKSGYYFSIASSPYCKFESPFRHLVIQPSDSLFVPNVLTPNGDGKNDQFTVFFQGTSPMSLTILNRYGQELFYTNSSQGWNGGDAPAGVYFWYVAYTSCKGDEKSAKGSLSLIR